jgi:hypothetical protein
VEPIHFRDHDFWKDLATDFNRVAARVRAAETHAIDADSESRLTTTVAGSEHA